MSYRFVWLIASAVVALCAGCATLSPSFEPPSVKVLGVRPMATGGAVPRFEIDLLVTNPNAGSLSLRGVSYRLYLNDLEVVEGVANELPQVPGYGEEQFTLPATVSLVDTMRFVGGMLRGDAKDVRWRLAARLDVGALLPPIRVEEEGVMSLETAGSPRP
jgi:LEA14-like dessication related protein